MAPIADEAVGFPRSCKWSTGVVAVCRPNLEAATEAAVKAHRFVDASFVAAGVFGRLWHFSLAMGVGETARCSSGSASV